MKPKDLFDEQPITSEERSVRFVTKVVAITLTVIILSMVGCRMHSNAYEADVLAQEALVKAEEAKMNADTANVKLEEIKATERMIENGANPVAIRCMQVGWKSNDGTCMAVGVMTDKLSEDNIE